MRKHSKQQYQDFIHDRHTSFTTDPHFLTDYLDMSLMARTHSLRRIVDGENNEVYAALSGNRPIIIRITRRQYPRYDIERWALGLCADQGVPTPKFLLVDQAVPYQDGQIGICIEERLPGRSLEELITSRTVPNDQIDQLIKESGRTLARVHRNQMEGVGWMNEPGRGEHASYAGMLDTYTDEQDLLERAADAAGLPRELIRDILQAQRQDCAMVDETRSVLLHNDFIPKHIFVENNAITGIIDMENVSSGHPVHDIAIWDFFYGHTLPLDVLLEGYEEIAGPIEDFERLHAWHNMNIHLHHLRHFYLSDHTYGLDHIGDKLIADLERYEAVA